MEVRIPVSVPKWSPALDENVFLIFLQPSTDAVTGFGLVFTDSRCQFTVFTRSPLQAPCHFIYIVFPTDV